MQKRMVIVINPSQKPNNFAGGQNFRRSRGNCVKPATKPCSARSAKSGVPVGANFTYGFRKPTVVITFHDTHKQSSCEPTRDLSERERSPNIMVGQILRESGFVGRVRHDEQKWSTEDETITSYCTPSVVHARLHQFVPRRRTVGQNHAKPRRHFSGTQWITAQVVMNCKTHDKHPPWQLRAESL